MTINNNPKQSELSRDKAIIYLVIAALLWSSGGLLIKLSNWQPIALAGARSLIAFLVLILFFGVPQKRPNKIQILAAIFYAMTVTLFVAANKYTTAANSILIQYTAPVYIIILGPWLLKERNTIKDILCVVFVLLGMILFFLDELSAGGMFGNMLAMASGVGFGLMVIFLRKQKDASPGESLIWGNLLTGLIALPFIVSQSFDLTNILSIGCLGVFQLGISYFLYAEAIKSVRALDAILIPTIEPILNPVWVFLFIGETPGMWAIIGGSIVVLTIIIKSLSEIPKSAGVNTVS